MLGFTPQPLSPGDLIGKAIDDAHADKQDDGFRAHLGASILGRDCERELWYSFHWVTRTRFEGRMLRLFRRGHNEEFTFVDDLRLTGAEVLPDNPATGEQWRYSILNGHVGGSCDGFARNLPGHGETPFITEYKTHSAKSFQKFFSKKAGEAREAGESVLKTAKPEHYAQCQLYMGWQGFKFALYGAVRKNDDQYYWEVIEFDPIVFAQLEAKAERILRAPIPPARCSDDPDFYVCNFCDHSETCHGEKIAELNCRTCIASTANLKGDAWTCSQVPGVALPDNVQRVGCEQHRYLPDLIPFATAVDSDPEARSISYEIIATDADPEPGRFINGRRSDGHYPSAELAVMNRELLADASFNLLRDKFDGTVIGTTPREPTADHWADDIPF
jgi:hypothetical protein